MFQQERLNAILDILKSSGYVTVKYLTEELHYSNATINRDLNVLQSQNLIKRSYGGAELAKNTGIPLVFRYHKMKSVKNRMGKLAADMINDGETVFIDGSSTTQFMGKYLTEKNDITVISNNMALIMHLSEYGINAICLGGKVLEPPNMLGGAEAEESAARLYADKLFFSLTGFNESGEALTGYTYYMLDKIMQKNSKKAYLMVSSDKFGKKAPKKYCTLGEVDCVISDYDFPDTLKEKFKSTLFVKA